MRHIHPIQVIGMIVLIAAFIYYRRKSAPKGLPKAAPPDADAAVRAAVEKTIKREETPEAAYSRLRRKAFETPASSLGPAGDGKEEQLFGLVLEIGMPGSVVTLACFANGDARVYYQTGGGMIGGIAHETTRKAAKEFVASGRTTLSSMTPAAGLPPLPDPEKVRFSALTQGGIYTAEMYREDLGESPSEFSSLFYRGQEVVAQMRQVQAQQVPT